MHLEKLSYFQMEKVKELLFFHLLTELLILERYLP